MASLLTVMLKRRMLGLSYSSIDMPRERRRCPKMLPSLEPPELVENARPRSMPGMQTDVNMPCPLQNSKIEWATLAGCETNESQWVATFTHSTIKVGRVRSRLYVRRRPRRLRRAQSSAWLCAPCSHHGAASQPPMRMGSAFQWWAERRFCTPSTTDPCGYGWKWFTVKTKHILLLPSSRHHSMAYLMKALT